MSIETIIAELHADAAQDTMYHPARFAYYAGQLASLARTLSPEAGDAASEHYKDGWQAGHLAGREDAIAELTPKLPEAGAVRVKPLTWDDGRGGAWCDNCGLGFYISDRYRDDIRDEDEKRFYAALLAAQRVTKT